MYNNNYQMSMKTVYPMLLLFSFCISILSCSQKKESANRIPYPQPVPDSTALRFLPGIVSTDVLDFNSAFSPDGKSFYFARSPQGKYEIYVSTHNGKEWDKPTVATFSERAYSEADPFITEDGSLYYISDRPRDKTDTISDFDIWFVRALPDGRWSEPENLVIVNSDSTEYYVSIAGNGNVYFASNRSGGYGEHDIYVSKFINGALTQPENLGASINSEQSEHDPYIAIDENFLVFKSENRLDGFGEADLYCSRLNSDKNWLPARNLGKAFNTNTYEYCPNMSPDGKYFFYSSESDVKWIDAEFLKTQISILHKE
jgi:Tol biopolymer transport system component